MSFLNLKKSEDRVFLIVLVLCIGLLAVAHGISYGWWAFLTVPLFMAICIGVSLGLTTLMRRARRKDLQREIDAEVNRALEAAGLEPVEVSNRPPSRESAWAKLWSPKRGR